MIGPAEVARILEAAAEKAAFQERRAKKHEARRRLHRLDALNGGGNRETRRRWLQLRQGVLRT